MKNIIFSRRNLDFKIVDLGLFSGILDLTWFYRAASSVMGHNGGGCTVLLVEHLAGTQSNWKYSRRLSRY